MFVVKRKVRAVLVLIIVVAPALYVAASLVVCNYRSEVRAIRRLGGRVIPRSGSCDPITGIEVIGAAGFSDRDFEELIDVSRNLQEVNSIRIVGTDIEGTRLQRAGELAHVKQVEISSCALDDRGLVNLVRVFPELVQLNIAQTHITDKAVIHLRECEQLEQLNVAYTRIGDEGVAALSEMSGLDELVLTGTDVSVRGVQIFLGSKQRGTIWVAETDLAEHEIKELQEQYPHARIYK